MIAEMLGCAGFVTGAFRSPHLVSYRERMTVGNGEISEGEWLWAFDLVRPVVEGMRAGFLPGYDLGRPTLFEVLFAMACLHFARRGVEWAAIETGLGGRLDATNLLQSDVAAVTNVSLEHTQILGTSIGAIAREKAAIIKSGAHAVTACQGEALQVIETRAQAAGAPLLVVGRDIAIDTLARSSDSQLLVLAGGGRRVGVKLPLGGAHQALNAAVAFGVGLSLAERGISISDDAIREGLEQVRVPGRWERVPGTPEVILDGAHNPAGISALAATLTELPPAPTTLIFAAMDDKDLDSMTAVIAPLVDRVVVTSVPDSERAADPSRLRNAFARANVSSVPASTPEAAWQAAQALTPPEGRVIIAGSMYLVGALRPLIMEVHV
jgi:dihydrofolate synthase/folylpolyglutamate synthase